MIIKSLEQILKNKEAQIGLILYRVSQGIEKMIRKQAEKEGLTSAQARTLLFLFDAHPESRYIGSIAQRLLIASPTATRIVDTLERKGLVERVRSKEDRRSVRVEVTGKGKEVLERISEAGNFLKSLANKLPKDHKEGLLEGLKDIMKSMQQEGYISFSMICRDCVYFEPNARESSPKPHLCRLTEEHLSEEESYQEWVDPDGKLREDCVI